MMLFITGMTKYPRRDRFPADTQKRRILIHELWPALPSPAMRKLLYYGIMIFLFLLVIELCLPRLLLPGLLPGPSHRQHPAAERHQDPVYRRYRDEDALIHRLRQNQYLVRPGLSHADNDEIDRQCRAANLARCFEPWLEFSFTDVRSKYVNVTDLRRFSTPDRSDSTAKDPLCIYFLGGSTMYGFDVTDAETIPSAFTSGLTGRNIPAAAPSASSIWACRSIIAIRSLSCCRTGFSGTTTHLSSSCWTG